MPKSMTRAWPSADTMTFEGFKSRWMMPRACAYSSASATSSASRAASGGATGPAARRSFSVWPSTYSIAM